MAETWKTIEGAQGYEVSSMGRVRSVPGVVMRSNGSPLSRRGRVLKHSLRLGYPRVRLGHGRYITVHSLVAAAFIGPRPDGLQVNHINHDRSDNRVENLEYLSRSENMRAANAFYGRVYPKGKRHCQARATAAQIRRAYRMLTKGHTLAEASDATGVAATSIQAAARGLSWKHLGLAPLKRIGGRRKGVIYPILKAKQ